MSSEIEFTESLDEEKKHMLIFRYRVSTDYASIESFAVIYAAEIDEVMHEIVKIDGSIHEAVHMHVAFSQKPKKILHQPLAWETIENAVDRIRKHWHEYWIQYQEAKGL